MENQEYNIFALSDYSLLHIFKYLSSVDLYNLSLTCKRFEVLVKEKKLWYKIDGRDGPNGQEKIKYCLDKVNERTTEFLVCCDRRDEQIFPECIFSLCDFQNLTVLALENQLIRGDLAKLSEYPKMLVELSLRKSFVHSHSTFFKHSYLHMENLKVLILDECGWVETYMLVPMSKYAKLEVLSLYQCKKLSDNDIAYLSLAGCFGFKGLKVLDIRFTGLGDQILKTFYKHPTLHEIYFQNYIATYKLDKTKRHLEIAHGSRMKPRPYFSEYDDVPDTDLPSLEQLFGSHFYRTRRTQNVTNNGTVMYEFVVPNLDVDYEIKSVLYTPPYGECKCGYEGRLKCPFRTTSYPKLKKIGTRREEINRLKDIIKREKYINRYPYVYALAPKLSMDPYKNKTNIACYDEQANKENKQIDWINVREPVNEYEIAMFEHTDIHSLQTEMGLSTVLTYNPGSPSVIFDSQFDYSVDSSDSSSEDERPNRLIVVEGKDIVIEERVEEIYRRSYRVKSASKEKNIEKENLSEDSGVKSEDSEESKNENSEINPINNDDPQVMRFSDKTATENTNGTCNRQNSLCGDNVAAKTANNEPDHKEDTNPSTSKDSQKSNCKVCSVEIVKSDERKNGMCKKCSDKSKPATVKRKMARCYGVANLLEEPDKKVQNCNSNNNVASTSKDTKDYSEHFEGYKSKRSSSCDERVGVKRFKLSSESDAVPSNIDYDLNISYEVEKLNEKVRLQNMFVIDLNERQPDFMDMRMGGGIINVLLGGEKKTKTAIRKLSLRGFPKVTDSTLESLETLKLDLLDVTKTGVTRHAVEDFIKKNPTCRVIHESACTCLPNMYF